MKQANPMQFCVLGATLAVASILVALTVVDVTATSQPSRVEREIASSWLSFKIELSRPTKTAPRQFDSNDVQRGSELYQRNCSFCHGSTDRKPGAYAESLSPRPPQFFRSSPTGPAWRTAYMIRHGVRWTGMPAFAGLTEDDTWRIATMLETQAGK